MLHKKQNNNGYCTYDDKTKHYINYNNKDQKHGTEVFLSPLKILNWKDGKLHGECLTSSTYEIIKSNFLNGTQIQSFVDVEKESRVDIDKIKSEGSDYYNKYKYE